MSEQRSFTLYVDRGSSRRAIRRLAKRLGLLSLSTLKLLPFTSGFSNAHLLKKVTFLAVLAGALVNHQPLHAAEFESAGSEFQVNTTTDDEQQRSDSAFDAEGNFVIAWQSCSGPDNDIYFQRYDYNGNAVGSETRVNTVTTDNQQHPAVAMDSDGDFVVVWTDRNESPDIVMQRYDSDGAAVGGNTVVSTNASNDYSRPDVAMADDGAFVVVWDSSNAAGDGGSGDGIAMQRYNASGVAQGGETGVNTTNASDQKIPAIGMDSDGAFVVVWEGEGPGDNFGIFMQRFNASGVAQGAETIVNTTTDDEQKYPDVAMNADGDFVVAWQSYDGSDSQYDILMQRFDSAGSAVGSETAVTMTTGDDEYAPAVAIASDGDFVVAWESYVDGDYDIQAQRFLSSGAADGDAFTVNTETGSYQVHPAVGMAPDGDFVVSWSSYDQDAGGSDYGVFAQRFEVAASEPAPEVTEVLDIDIPNTSSTGGGGGSVEDTAADNETGLTPNTFNSNNARARLRFRAKDKKVRISRARFTLPTAFNNLRLKGNGSAASDRDSQTSAVVTIDDNVLELLSLTLQPGQSFDLDFLADAAEDVSTLEELFIALQIDTDVSSLSTSFSLSQSSGASSSSELTGGSGNGSGCALESTSGSRNGVLALIGGLLGFAALRRRRKISA